MTTSQHPIGPVDATRVPRYAGPATFARIPFDSGVSYRPGARFGPGHIRASSKLLRPYHPRLDVAPFAAQQVADAGDIADHRDIGTGDLVGAGRPSHRYDHFVQH
jgi:agmatinase